MNKFVEASNALLKRIDNALATNKYGDTILATKNDPDLILDCRIFIHEFGNLPMWQEIEDARFANLHRLKNLLEKVPDIVALRKQESD